MQRCSLRGIKYLFNSDRRDELIATIKALHFELNKKNLPIYGVSTKNLKDFVATQNEKSRGFQKIPTIEFRMWEADIDKEERKKEIHASSQSDSANGGAGLGDYDDLEQDFVDDFVIIDRQKAP
jgi:hypothetical protein